jgi:hypothetical protein
MPLRFFRAHVSNVFVSFSKVLYRTLLGDRSAVLFFGNYMDKNGNHYVIESISSVSVSKQSSEM